MASAQPQAFALAKPGPGTDNQDNPGVVVRGIVVTY